MDNWTKVGEVLYREPELISKKIQYMSNTRLQQHCACQTHSNLKKMCCNCKNGNEWFQSCDIFNYCILTLIHSALIHLWSNRNREVRYKPDLNSHRISWIEWWVLAWRRGCATNRMCAYHRDNTIYVFPAAILKNKDICIAYLWHAFKFK